MLRILQNCGFLIVSTKPMPISDSSPLSDSEYERRFGGIARLYGNSGFGKLQKSHVCVVGVGGVGSWVVEALARSAVGQLTLIDLDHVAESNVNRQLQALSSSLGKAKVLALKERILDINPRCQVNTIEEFVEPDNMSELLTKDYDYVVDCIDGFRTKAKLIAHCRRNKIKLITVGGAGGQVDPSLIRITDLSKTIHDPLMSKVRKLLRTDYGFSSNPKRKFSVPCVYSEEPLVYPTPEGEVCQQKPEAGTTGLNCAAGFGSITPVTGSFGFYAASYVLNKLAKGAS